MGHFADLRFPPFRALTGEPIPAATDPYTDHARRTWSVTIGERSAMRGAQEDGRRCRPPNADRDSDREARKAQGGSRDTGILVDAGEHCQCLLDEYLVNLPCQTIEADEIWTFVRKKQGHLTAADQLDPEAGDQYTFVGFDPVSKLVAAHVVGRRNAETTTDFLDQLRERVPHGRIPDFPVTRSHPPASWPSAANSSSLNLAVAARNQQDWGAGLGYEYR